MDFLTGAFFVVLSCLINLITWTSLLWVSDVPKGSSGQEESSQADGNPMIEPVCTAAGHGRCNGQCNGKREICRERPPDRDVRASG